MNKTCLKAFPCVPLLFLTIVGAWFVFHSHKGGVALAVAAQTCGQWSIIPSANPNSSNVLFGVAVISANDVWAVGNGVSKEGDSRALAEQWNGRTWKAVTTPGGAGNYLRDVVALSANNVWAVGDDQHNAKPESTLIEQWNGTAWRVIASPNAGTAGDFLFHVSAASANDIWAVGYDANSTTYRTFIEHWDGTAWKIIPSPNLNNSESGNSELNTLNSVAVVSPNDVWAVGDVELSNNSGSNHMLPEQTLIEHWNGSRWSIVASPNPDALGDGLYGMAAISATNIWAVGNGIESNSTEVTLIEHWNGTVWKVVASQTPQMIHIIPNLGGQSTILSGVAVVAANNIWAVGEYIDNSGIYQTLIEHWNGKLWSLVSSPNLGSDDSYLLDTATIPDTAHVWAVGYAYGTTASTLTEYFC